MLAIWSKDGFSYSLSISSGAAEETWGGNHCGGRIVWMSGEQSVVDKFKIWVDEKEKSFPFQPIKNSDLIIKDTSAVRGFYCPPGLLSCRI